MTTRPERKPLLPLVNPSARTPEELAESLRRIYAGALADHRSIEAGEGVYAVRVLAPLEVTDEGVGLNWHDPIVFGVLRDLIGEAGLVKVDPGDVPDYLGAQIITYDATPPGGYSVVEIVQPHGAGTPLMGRLYTGVGGNQPNPSHSGDTNSIELKVHYKGTNTVTELVSGLDWRKFLVRAWARCSRSLAKLLTMDNMADPSSVAAAGLWPICSETPTLEVVPIVMTGTDAGISVTFRCYVDANTGNLYLKATNGSPATYRGAWTATPSPAYAVGEVVSHNGSHYQFGGPNNAEPPSNDWAAYTVPEAYFHARLDVMGQVPDDGQAYTAKGNVQ